MIVNVDVMVLERVRLMREERDKIKSKYIKICFLSSLSVLMSISVSMVTLIWKEHVFLFILVFNILLLGLLIRDCYFYYLKLKEYYPKE